MPSNDFNLCIYKGAESDYTNIESDGYVDIPMLVPENGSYLIFPIFVPAGADQATMNRPIWQINLRINDTSRYSPIGTFHSVPIGATSLSQYSTVLYKTLSKNDSHVLRFLNKMGVATSATTSSWFTYVLLRFR